MGSVEPLAGTYLPWLAHRATLGVHADTLVVATLFDAVIRVVEEFGETASGSHREWDRTHSLPQHIRSPTPREAVREFEWIQVNGDQVVIDEIPQILTATFDRKGNLFAVRPYRAVRERIDGGATGWKRRWRPTHLSLDIYDIRGNDLGRFDLPFPTVRWIRVDGVGRILVSPDPQRIVVFANPLDTLQPCAGAGGLIRIDTTDAPEISKDEQSAGR